MNSRNFSFSSRLRYKFDNLMSRGSVAMIGLLVILSILLVVTSGVLIYIFEISPGGGSPIGLIEGLWQSLMRALDSGTIGGDESWSFRGVALFVTMGGIFIISTLIGVLSSGIEMKLSDLRKGRSYVVEKNHIVILGWSNKIFTIISELCIAGENQKDNCIVILANRDKVEMEDDLRSKVTDFKRTRVICRSGVPEDLTDLEIVNLHDSRSIIILGSEGPNGDAKTIKCILAITNNPSRREYPYHIIADIKEKKNLEVAKMVGKDEVILLFTDDIISRLLVQTSRQCGLSFVFQELLDFEGDEIYFMQDTKLYGKTFEDCIFKYEDSTIIGVQYADGKTHIYPDIDYIMQEGDSIVAISRDDNTIISRASDDFEIDRDAVKIQMRGMPGKAHYLLIGWNKLAKNIICELDKYVGQNSEITVVCTYEKYQDEVEKIKDDVNNLNIEFKCADSTDLETMNALDIAKYNNILVISYSDDLEMQEADAHTLITLLHLRRLSEELKTDLNIVSEMLDSKNRNLAVVTKVDDFIVSDNLISLLISQVAENKHLMSIFEELMNSEGCEIYIHPVAEYITLDKPQTFYTILESAKIKNEIAIGYRLHSQIHDEKNKCGIHINPVKSRKIQFSQNDKIIVLSKE